MLELATIWVSFRATRSGGGKSDLIRVCVRFGFGGDKTPAKICGAADADILSDCIILSLRFLARFEGSTGGDETNNRARGLGSWIDEFRRCRLSGAGWKIGADGEGRGDGEEGIELRRPRSESTGAGDEVNGPGVTCAP